MRADGPRRVRRCGLRTNHRHRWLLRARRKRPHSRRAAEKREEIASPHVRPQAQEAPSYRLK